MRRYGRRHRELRAEWVPLVDAGGVRCARCNELIEPGSRWHLGHDDVFPKMYSGPEHPACNEAAPHQLRVSRVW